MGPTARWVHRHKGLSRFIKKWRTDYSVLSFLLVVAVILPGSIILFPDSSLWLGILIVILAAMDELKDLADQIEDEGDETA